MKYIIELEEIEGTGLWRAKGASTLVFDENGIKNILKPYKEDNDNYDFKLMTYKDMEEGDIFKTPGGNTLYEFHSISKDGKRINVINIDKGTYACLPIRNNYLCKKFEVEFGL